mgnify:FL=1|tara:strand:- start:142 stop:378 length:237 start_codon:yes stop_codon:yes gene_type:complete
MTDERPDDEGIRYTLEIPYEDVRLLYHCVQETIKSWPGSPARPWGEQEHLWHLRDSLYRAVLDYRFNFLDVDKKDNDG